MSPEEVCAWSGAEEPMLISLPEAPIPLLAVRLITPAPELMSVPTKFSKMEPALEDTLTAPPPVETAPFNVTPPAPASKISPLPVAIPPALTSRVPPELLTVILPVPTLLAMAVNAAKFDT